MTRGPKSLEDWCKENNRLELLKEWDEGKNSSLRFPKYISESKYNSPHKAHWKCKENHTWEMPIVARTLFLRTCTTCNPDMVELPVGTQYGCLTIVAGFEAYHSEVAIDKIFDLEKSRSDFLQGIRSPWSNVDSVDYYDNWIQYYKTHKTYKCRCNCGLVHFIDEFHFFEKKHRFCPSEECGLKLKQKENLLNSYKREYDKSFYLNILGTFHESLEVLECLNHNYEELYSYNDKRKKGGGTYKIYKIYKCKCYLCGKEQELRSDKFSINPPSQFGYRAYGGFYSEAYCDCHKISSFQWIVTKLLKEHDVSYRVEFTFPDLYWHNNLHLLRFDFAILNKDGSLKCLMECQGEQHYKPVEEFGGQKQFIKQQEKDNLKRSYANRHNIPLYEISYKNKNFECVETFLKNCMII